jgi:hypothetical protein
VACGYSLRGIADLRCPECGTDYAEELVLIGDPLDRTRPRVHGPHRLAPPTIQVVLSGLGIAALTWAMLARLPFGLEVRLMAAASVGVVVATLTLNETRKLHSATDDAGAYDPNRFHAAILRVRRSGFAMRTGYGPFRFKPWSRHHQIRMGVSRGRNRLRLTVFRVWHGIPLWRVIGMRIDLDRLDIHALRRALRKHAHVTTDLDPRVWDDN